MNLPAIQSFLRQSSIDAWLLYDFRGSNSILYALLPPKAGDKGGGGGGGAKRFTTRRIFLHIPAHGEPTMLVHGIDASQFDDVASGPGGSGGAIKREVYLSWHDLHSRLAARLSSAKTLAMEYSPRCELPVVSIADAGTVELIRHVRPGIDIVSSADLIQVAVATWSAQARKDHALASEQVNAAKDSAFALIRDSLAAGKPISEFDVCRHIHDRFRAAGLEWPDGPIVAVNAHSADPHYEPTEKSSAPIRKGDWVLIDLWARRPGDHNIHSDITWVGYCGSKPTAKHLEVFNAVKGARDAAVECARRAWQNKETLHGWQVDDAAMKVIRDAGFGDFIRHRTGHSLSPGPKVHGNGVNIDNLETHDTRRILPGIGYTIEPGIYLPGESGFGVRLEINVYVDPANGPEVTSHIQSDPILM